MHPRFHIGGETARVALGTCLCGGLVRARVRCNESSLSSLSENFRPYVDMCCIYCTSCKSCQQMVLSSEGRAVNANAFRLRICRLKISHPYEGDDRVGAEWWRCHSRRSR
jgi:hypothetical protein